MLFHKRMIQIWRWRMDGLSNKTNSIPRHPWSAALPYIPSTQNCNRSTHLSRWKHILRLSKVRCLHRARIPRVLPSMWAIPRLVKIRGGRGNLHRLEWLWGWLCPRSESENTTEMLCELNSVASALNGLYNLRNILLAGIVVGSFHHHADKRLGARLAHQNTTGITQCFSHSFDSCLHRRVVLRSLLSVTRTFSRTCG